MRHKHADAQHPIHDLTARRWSPYVFSERPVDPADLRSIFEAARWAASSYNEQPWRWIVATADEPAEHARLLSCLVEGNQVWARRAPVLGLGISSLRFERNGRDNPAALHDLGLAAGNLSHEVTARGLHVHWMIGILPERARELYGIPDGFQPLTGFAIGYLGDLDAADDKLRARDLAPRTRKPLGELVFRERWGRAAL
jgi:nitroreductase